MYTVIVVIHVVVCVFLILVVLLQAGRSSGIAGLFGGGGSDQLFSAPSGMAFVKKLTVIAALVFVVTTLSLTVYTARMKATSVTNQIPYIPVEQPVVPE